MGVIARQSIKGALANYLGVAIGFLVTFFVLTRCLTAEEVGLTRVMVDAAMLFSGLAQLGTSASLVRYFPHFKDSHGNHGIFGLALLVPLIGFALIATLLLIFRGPLVEAYSLRSPLVADYFYFIPMLTFFVLYLTVFETGASVLMRITVPKMVREVGVRVFNLVAYLLYGWGLIDLDAFVWMFCGSYALAMLLGLFYWVKIAHADRRMLRIDWHFLDKARRREMGQYTLFMTATVLAGNISLVGSLFLGAKTGLALTGVYTIASYIANVVEVPYRSLGAISRPVVAAAVKEEQWGEVNRLVQQVSLHQLMVSSLIFYLIWINLPTLYALIPNGGVYVGGMGVVALLGMAKIINSSFSIATDLLSFSTLYQRVLPLIALLTASVLLLNSLLIGPLGINGAASAMLISYLIYFALLLTLLGRRLGVSLFSKAQAKVVAIMLGAFLLNAAWVRWVGAEGQPVGRMLIDSVAKSLVLGGGVVAATLLWHVSPTVNAMINKQHKNTDI